MGLGIDKIWQMIGNQKESNKPTYAKATVLRRDNDGTIWVKIEGGVDETPAYSTTANVKPNDVVTVKVAGGKVYIEGSTSSPSVGVTEFDDAVTIVNKNVKKVDEKADKAAEDSKAAIEAAKEADELAKATNQHFWVNDDEPETYGGSGAHVTEQERDDWVEAIRRRFPDLSDEKPYHNILMNSLGILLRTALNNLVSITRSAVTFFDGTGNDESNIVAYFGKDGARIGPDNDASMNIENDHISGYSKEGLQYIDIAMDGDLYTKQTESERFTISASSTMSITLTEDMFKKGTWPPSGGYPRDIIYLGVIKLTTPPTSGSASVQYGVSSSGVVIDGIETNLVTYEYDGNDTIELTTFSNEVSCRFSYFYGAHSPSYALGDCDATAPYSMAEGEDTLASGSHSHAEGFKSTADEVYSHAEGSGTTASGTASHSEGMYTKVQGTGLYGHAEGSFSVVRGVSGHAEGSNTYANGGNSHAQNRGTIASGEDQTTIGKYNVEDTDSTYALIIGNGTADGARSNAFTVDWDGKITCGHVINGGASWAALQTTNGNDLRRLQVDSNGNATVYTSTDDGANWSGRRLAFATGGDTLTGQYYIKNPNAGHVHLDIVSSLMKRGENPTQDVWAGLQFCGSDNARIAYLEAHKGASGIHEMGMYLLDDIASTEIGYGGFKISKPHGTTGNAIMVFNVDTGRLSVPGGIVSQNDIQLRGASNDTPDLAWYYANGKEKCRIWADDTYTTNEGLNYRVYKEDGTHIFSGRLLSSGGGTITGGLVLDKVWLTIKTDGDRDGANPSSDQWLNGISMVDVNNETIGQLRPMRRTNGRTDIRVAAFNEKTDGTEVVNELYLRVDRTGAATYYVTNAANFRSAIGAAASSDRRLKSDVSVLCEDAVAFIDALEPCVYTINGERQVGLIAQDVYEADTWGTRMAFETEEGIDGLDDWEKMEDGSPTWKLDYIRIIPPLVATVKSQAKRIEELEDKVSRLEKLVESIMKS